jgi:hypothetical protein
MQIEIFPVTFFVNDGPAHREETMRGLKRRVNEFLKLHSNATVQWLQTSCANEREMTITLTAIISYDTNP